MIAAINEAGMRVGITPDCDIRIAGHDNLPLSAYTSPPLTTVSQDTNRMGQIALDLLFSKMGQGDAPVEGDQVLLNAELIFRKSA